MNRDLDALAVDWPDAEALRELEQLIQSRLQSRVRDFQLSFRDDGLILRGQTQTYYAKQLVQHEVMQAIDLRIRANEIEVC